MTEIKTTYTHHMSIWVDRIETTNHTGNHLDVWIRDLNIYFGHKTILH